MNPPFAVQKLGHVVVNVSDIEASKRFYTEVLGFRISDIYGGDKMPGGMVCIVAVPAQHRGRLFLPFADDDPKTAEVISKVLLLARDHEIQDPSILEQLQ